jgi:hypothetical protein
MERTRHLAPTLLGSARAALEVGLRVVDRGDVAVDPHDLPGSFLLARGRLADVLAAGAAPLVLRGDGPATLCGADRAAADGPTPAPAARLIVRLAAAAAEGRRREVGGWRRRCRRPLRRVAAAPSGVPSGAGYAALNTSSIEGLPKDDDTVGGAGAMREGQGDT